MYEIECGGRTVCAKVIRLASGPSSLNYRPASESTTRQFAARPHSPLHRLNVLARYLVVEDVRDVVRDLALVGALVDADGHDTNGPSGIADRKSEVRVLRLRVQPALAVVDHFCEVAHNVFSQVLLSATLYSRGLVTHAVLQPPEQGLEVLRTLRVIRGGELALCRPLDVVCRQLHWKSVSYSPSRASRYSSHSLSSALKYQ